MIKDFALEGGFTLALAHNNESYTLGRVSLLLKAFKNCILRHEKRHNMGECQKVEFLRHTLQAKSFAGKNFKDVIPNLFFY